MKKVLVTGASGTIGIQVLNNLLSENRYEITALDIKSKETMKRLKNYHKSINIVYGDIEDSVLIDALIKDHDYVIHLAGVMPPLCNLSKSFGEKIDYVGTENIIRSISFYNPKCFLIFPSTTTLYERKEKEITVSSKIAYSEEDYFSHTKELCENLIKEKLKKYVIFRIPFILGDLTKNKAIYLYHKKEELEVISDRDVAVGLANAVEHDTELNKKIKILSGGANWRINANDLFIKILETSGYSFSFAWNQLFPPYKYYGNIFKKDKKLNDLLKYQNDTLDLYFRRLKKQSKQRVIGHLLTIPIKKKLAKQINK